MTKCNAETYALNCGCCSYVMLDCDLENEHATEWHEGTQQVYGAIYDVRWKVVDQKS